MRDLASQGFRDKASSVNNNARGKYLLIVIVVGGLLLAAKGLFLDKSFGAGAVVLRDAPTNLKPVSFDGEQIDVEGGIDLVNDTARFSDVSGSGGKATATRTYGDGSFSVSVSATLPDPKSGDKYQVWLSSGSNIKDAGFMSGSKTSWSLIFRDQDKYRSYNQIWITREITTEEGKPEKHILEGSF